MIDGMIVLETAKTTILYDWQLMAIAFFVVCFFTGFFLLIGGSSLESTLVSIGLLVVSILLVVSVLCTKPKLIVNRYKVYIDEQCNIPELLNDYNIISCEGRILIIEDKESVELE